MKAASDALLPTLFQDALSLVCIGCGWPTSVRRRNPLLRCAMAADRSERERGVPRPLHWHKPAAEPGDVGADVETLQPDRGRVAVFDLDGALAKTSLRLARDAAAAAVRCTIVRGLSEHGPTIVQC